MSKIILFFWAGKKMLRITQAKHTLFFVVTGHLFHIKSSSTIVLGLWALIRSFVNCILAHCTLPPPWPPTFCFGLFLHFVYIPSSIFSSSLQQTSFLLFLVSCLSRIFISIKTYLVWRLVAIFKTTILWAKFQQWTALRTTKRERFKRKMQFGTFWCSLQHAICFRNVKYFQWFSNLSDQVSQSSAFRLRGIVPNGILWTRPSFNLTICLYDCPEICFIKSRVPRLKISIYSRIQDACNTPTHTRKRIPRIFSGHVTWPLDIGLCCVHKLWYAPAHPRRRVCKFTLFCLLLSLGLDFEVLRRKKEEEVRRNGLKLIQFPVG